MSDAVGVKMDDAGEVLSDIWCGICDGDRVELRHGVGL